MEMNTCTIAATIQDFVISHLIKCSIHANTQTDNHIQHIAGNLHVSYKTTKQFDYADALPVWNMRALHDMNRQ